MGKESDFLKAVKANDVEKIEKLYNPSSASIMRKKDKHFPTTEELIKSNQIIHLRHLNVNCQEEDSGYTPLIIAVLNGNHDISASLIRHGADINGQDFKGNTALHMATFNGRSDLVDVLLAAGAKVNKLNLDGNTPLHIACQAFTQGKLMLILKMLKAGANPVIKNKAGDTALDITAMFNRQEAASALLDHEPKLRENTSAIVGAAIRGSSEIVQLLLDYGVNPNGICIKQRTRPLHEAVRYERWETVKLLLSYGADPLMQNDKGQTAESIALQCGNEKASKFIGMFKEYENRAKDTPRFLKLENLPLSPVEEGLVPRYPLLDNKISWTRNTEEYCNNCTALHNNTNLLDNNPCSFWVIPATHHAWVVFDLEHEHTLTGMRIVGWESPQMPKTVELQKANSLRGKWQTVTSFNVKQKGSQSPKDPGVPQDFLGFCSTSRYWRFHILDNHGGPCTCFQGIQFYGIDARVLSFFEQLGLMQYAEEFIKKGYNCCDSMMNVHSTDLEKMVPLEMHRRQVSIALKDLKLKVYPIRRLAWLKSPVNMAREGESLPPFVIQSDPEVSEELSLFVHGKAEVKGRTTVSLIPQGPMYPSMATFEGIEIYPAGRYLIEVHCTRFPQLSVKAPQHIEIVQRAKDPSEVTAAFDELEDMLRSMQASLGESLNGNS